MIVYYAYIAFEIIKRVINIEHKMYMIDQHQATEQSKIASIDGSRFTVERSIIDNEIDLKQNNLRKSVYTKIAIMIGLMFYPLLVQKVYNKYTYKSINPIVLTLVSLGLNSIVQQMIDLELTPEEIDFADKN